MFQILGNIIFPVFSLIFLGYLLKLKGIVQACYVKTANQIVYYAALPAMLFSATLKAPLRANFDEKASLCVLIALGILVVMALWLTKIIRTADGDRGTFLQGCFHGNIGYMSYAIAYYALGESQFAKTAILSSVVIIGQNLLAVWALTVFKPDSKPTRKGKVKLLLKYALQNPIILSVVSGVFCSATGFPVPGPVRQGLDMLSGMALPTALILIGASLSFSALQTHAKEMIGISVLKLVSFPALGYALMKIAQVPEPLVVSGLILLGSPPATITYVMAEELGGNPELAANSVTVGTLLSAVTYSILLWLLNR